jgi:uncharacterized protein (TIGR02246 family)
MVTVFPTTTPTADVDALIGLVAELRRTQREEDVEGFLALFAPDATWVNGAGQRLVGREKIAAFTRRVLPGAMAGGTVDYTVEHVRVLAPDLALTGVRQEYLDAEGGSLGLGSPTYVWRREPAGWRIVVGQNTTYEPEHLQDRLVAQPIGYWSGEAYRRIAAAIRGTLAERGLSQPQWWILNHLDAGPHTRAELIEKLADYSTREEGRDIAAEFDALVESGLVDATAVMTPAGRTRLAEAREHSSITQATIRNGVSDDEYARTIDVLRRMVGNLGGDPRLPS